MMTIMVGPRRIRWLAAGAAALVLLQAVPRPVRGEGRGVHGPLRLLPKDAALIETSAELERLLQRRGALLGEGPETALVRRVGEAIAPHEPVDDYQRFRFGVVRSPVANAFALADGQVYVHAGLLALLENEAQLAAVLAHECVHVEGHHAILHARQARKKAGWMVVLGITLGQVGTLLSLPIVHATIGYGRDLETEADHRAAARLVEAGYDPRVLPRVFELLAEDPEAEHLDPSPAWSSHPLAAARGAAATARLAELAPGIAAAEVERGPLRIGAEGFTQTVEASMNWTIDAMLDHDRPRHAASLARRATERWPESPQAWALLGESLRHLDTRLEVVPEGSRTKKAKRARLRELERLTREEREALRRSAPGGAEQVARNLAAARAAYLKALDLDEANADALRGLAFVEEDAGNLLAAGELLARYLAAAPEGDVHRPEAVKKLAALTAALRGSAPALSGGPP